MLSFENLSINYDDEAPALLDFNLEIKASEIIALVGESGSGKTTVIRAAIGLLPGNANIINGSIELKRQSLLNMSPRQWKDLRGRDISMIFQDAGAMLNPIRTIGSQFIEYIRIHEKISKKDAWKRAIRMLDKMGLPHSNIIMKSHIFQLSGGMRQRVGIAMAMTFQPEILLADEPTSALDVTTQAQIMEQMLELRSEYKTSILLVTHNLAMAAYMADRILVMKDGRLVEEGNPREIISNPRDDYTRSLIKAVPDMGGERYV